MVLRDISIKSIISWLKDYMKENSSEPDRTPVVIGISGGKDSSVVAALCVRAFGAGRIIPVLLPHGIQADIDKSFLLLKHLGLNQKCYKYINKDISKSFKVLLPYKWNSNPALGVNRNTLARIRMIMLYQEADLHGGRVANTSNLSERYIGWTTKWGDQCGDFSLLGNMTCTEVVTLGRRLGLPKELYAKVPEDGLSGKTDEENFGFTYKELDTYLLTSKGTPEILEKIQNLHETRIHKNCVDIPTYNVFTKVISDINNNKKNKQ